MKCIVEWAEEALAEFELALEFIAAENPKSADRVEARIIKASSDLMDFQIGRPGRVSGTYEKVVSRTPYILAYTLAGNTVTILRVIHAARDWPEGEWPV